MFGKQRTVRVTVSRVLSPEDAEDGRSAPQNGTKSKE